MELASSLVDDYLNKQLEGVEPANTVMEYVFRDFSSNDAIWKNGETNIF